MIPDKRAERFGDSYLEDGKEVVMFNPKLTLEEWEYLMHCQKVANEKKPEETIAVEKKLIDDAKAKKIKREETQTKKVKKDDEENAETRESFNK